MERSWAAVGRAACSEAQQRKAKRGTILPALLPASPTRAYDWEKATSENYRSPGRKFFGPYASIRSTLDYEYHAHYTCARCALAVALASHCACGQRPLTFVGRPSRHPTTTSQAIGARSTHHSSPPRKSGACRRLA